MQRYITFLFTCFVFISLSSVSFAQSSPGCDNRVKDAQDGVADLRVLNEVAINEHITPEPDSVLAMTCFDQSSRISAAEGGSIFSGDFTDAMNDVVNDPLSHLLSTGFLDSIGKSPNFSGVVTSAISDLLSGLFPGFFPAEDFDCTVGTDLWDDMVTTGIDGSVARHLGIDEMLGGGWVTGGMPTNNFVENFEAENGPGGAIDRARTAMDNLPIHTIPNTNGLNSLSEILSGVGY